MFNFVDNEIMPVINEFRCPISINNIFNIVNHTIYLHLELNCCKKISIGGYRKIISLLFLFEKLYQLKSYCSQVRDCGFEFIS